MSTKRVSQPPNESHPPLADGAVSEESQALAEPSCPDPGAQTAQRSDKRIGYVLASAVYRNISIRDETLQPGGWEYTPSPQCVPSRSSVMMPTQYYHQEREPTGSVRLGPVHYFADCGFLTGQFGNPGKSGGGRKIVEMSMDMLAVLPSLGTCQRCINRLDKESERTASNLPNQRAHRTEEERTRQQTIIF